MVDAERRHAGDSQQQYVGDTFLRRQIFRNIRNMHMDNMRVSFSQKSVTFDGQEHEVTRLRLNRPSESRVRAAANTIASMVQAAIPRNQCIQLMTLYFKLGHGDQIWFLWCGALQLRDRSAISDFLKAPLHNPLAKASAHLDDDDDGGECQRPLTAVCVKPVPKAATAALQRLKTPESDESDKEEPWVNSRERRMRQLCNAPPVNCAICTCCCPPSRTYAVTYAVLLTHFLTHGSALGCELLGIQVGVIE